MRRSQPQRRLSATPLALLLEAIEQAQRNLADEPDGIAALLTAAQRDLNPGTKGKQKNVIR
ncbi:MAG: hypothetical protein ACREV4_14320 [Gammaproteobacteria bacterium]